ncbi:hypothetical protein PanWU01x14_098700 [Parasponia andersonii]|uniref:Uncharacterized protein n=1 Tax=Parasponia andersonii TaxID=3476 RepID=A0A2P5D469_PARAD|nr:hypothetical protein PanWU01x14_098700 [Parasponia andersonii]
MASLLHCHPLPSFFWHSPLINPALLLLLLLLDPARYGRLPNSLSFDTFAPMILLSFSATIMLLSSSLLLILLLSGLIIIVAADGSSPTSINDATLQYIYTHIYIHRYMYQHQVGINRIS